MNAAALFVCLLSAPPSTYQRVDADKPRPGTPLIEDKLYPLGGRFELDASFVISFNDKYVQHEGGEGAVAYHLLDWLALEGYGGWLYGDQTGLIKNSRNLGVSHERAVAGERCAQPTCEPQLPDMWMTTWFGGADVQWAPIYGKLSAVSELDLTFALYLRAGGGVEGIERALNIPGKRESGGVRVSGNAGVGVRVMPWKYLAVRAEVIDTGGPNPNVQEHEGPGFADFSNDTMLHVGLSVLL